MKGDVMRPIRSGSTSKKWWMLALGLLFLLVNLCHHETQHQMIGDVRGHWRDYFRKGEEPSIQCEQVSLDEYMPVGKHYLIDFYEVDLAQLDMLASVEGYDQLFAHIRAAGMTILDWSGHRFECGGVTGFVLLSESHVSFHSWPEHKFLAVDVYTCGSGKPDVIVSQLEKMFKPGKIDKTLVRRGRFAQVIEEQIHVERDMDQSPAQALTHDIDLQARPEMMKQTSPKSGISTQTPLFLEERRFNSSLETDILRVEDICVNADTPEDDCMLLRNAKILADVKSDYQQVEIADTQSYERCMFLDRVVQFCTSDNDIYTANIVNPVIEPFVNAEPVNVQIVGGGDGWVANYLFDRYANIVHAVNIVDIDPVVPMLTAAHFHPVGPTDSFEDPRVTWVFEDAWKWLREKGKTASVELVIIDCTDHNVGSSTVLYTPEFYKEVHRILKKGGRVVQQMNTHEEDYEPFLKEAENAWLNAGFRNIKKWSVYIPSFGGNTSFWLADV